MLDFAEALATVLGHVTPGKVVTIPLSQAVGSVLAQSVTSPFDVPRFDHSAMDGFGVCVADLVDTRDVHPTMLLCTATVQAGDAQLPTISPGETVAIFTGAPIPPGVEAVVMQEFCQRQVVGQGQVAFGRSAKPGENIRRQGEEFKAGQTVLPQGTIITPPVVGLLATLGISAVSAYAKPKVGLLITGNELVPPGEQQMGIDSQVYVARDEITALLPVVRQALNEVDMLISLGGVSVGDYDLVKAAYEQMTVSPVFWKIAIKPGKPVFFGLPRNHRAHWVFGLPGNPVSALVTFHQLVRPALLQMMGYHLSQPRGEFNLDQAQLTMPLHKKPGRLEFVRAVATRHPQHGLQVTPTTGQDSHMLGGLAMANCLMHFAREAETLAVGDRVPIQWLDWGLPPNRTSSPAITRTQPLGASHTELCHA
jgi:molybdopterin molybdotransferase